MDWKVPPFAVAWLWTNLLFTCVAEEAFFRGLLQERLTRIVPAGTWQAAPVALSALLFGAAHLGGGAAFAGLATIAGVGYSIAYATTRRIEAAVLTHFAVNTTHFLAFTYPYLAK